MKCKNHKDIDAVARCTGCQEAFCENCLVEMNGKKYCGDCKIMAVREIPIIEDKSLIISFNKSWDPLKNSLIKTPYDDAWKALKYAIFGIFFLGFILGPIAIAKALWAKERFREMPYLTDNGTTTKAIIIGIIAFIIWMIILFKEC